MSPKRWLPLVPLGLFLLAVAIAVAPLSIAPRVVEPVLVIDLRVEQSSYLMVFWNEFGEVEVPARHDTIGARRVEYKVTLPPLPLYRLRIDPTHRSGDEVTIYRVALRLADGSEINIPLHAIATWAFVDTTTPPRLVDGGLTFRSTSGNPYLYGPVDLPPGNWHEVLSTFARKHLRSRDFVMQVLLIGALMTLAAGTRIRLLTVFLFAMSAVFSLLYFGPRLYSSIFHTDRFDVSQAVGHAAFMGGSIDPTRWTAIVAAVLALAFGLAVGKWVAADIQPAPIRDGGPHSGKLDVSRGVLIGCVWVLLLAIVLMPDLGAIAQSKLTRQFPYEWDWNNTTAWAGFIAAGMRPYVDFWYPYSGHWIFELPLPAGPLLQFAYRLILYSLLAAAFWRLFDRRMIAFLAVAGLIVLFGEAGVLTAPDRYLLSIAVTLTFVAIDRSAPLLRSGRVWFWIACTLALWGEPAQLLYAAPAVAIALAYDEIRAWPGTLRGMLARGANDFAVPAAALLGLLAVFAWRGELQGFIETNFEIAASTIYGTIPHELGGHFRKPLSIFSLGVFAPYLLLFVGGFLVLTRPVPVERRLGLAVLCLAIVAVMITQKHFIRSIDGQLLLTSIISSLLLLVLFWNYFWGRAVVAFVMGMLCAVIALNEPIANVGRQLVLGAPSRIASSYRALAEPARFEAANRAAFAVDRFTAFNQELAVAQTAKAIGNGSIFVLGDMPILYLFSPGPTPFHVNQYNNSPISAQVAMQAWLAATKPDVVVLEPSSFKFDNIQLVVRVPLIANEVVLNYVPRERIGPYSVLVRRAAGEPIALAFWREAFGAEVDYGHLLTNIRSGRLPDCPVENRGPLCVRYLRLDFSSDVASPQRFEVPVEVGPFEFRIFFVRRPGVRTYLVPIDRLWFWVAGENMGFTPRPRIAPESALKTTIVAKSLTRPILY